MIRIEGNDFEAKGTTDQLVQDLLNVIHSMTRTLYMNVPEEDREALLIGLCNIATDAILDAQTDRHIGKEHFNLDITIEED